MQRYTRRRKLRRHFRIFFLVSLIGLLGLFPLTFATDFLAGKWLEKHPSAHLSFMLSRPAPYQDADYWSIDFINALEKIGDAIQTDEGFLVPADLNTPQVNIEKGIRRTTDQPDKARHTIYMFGNSTLLGTTTPDDKTISSYLQRKISADYKVINLGINGYYTFNETDRLKSIPLQRGDIVIFYDGISELDYMWWVAKSRSPSLCFKLIQNFHQVNLIRLLCGYANQSVPDDLHLSPDEIKAWLNLYDKVLDDARTYSQQAGAEFFHFLQPHIFSRPLSAYERQLIGDTFLVKAGLEEIFEQVWPQLQVTPETIDLTHVLDAARAQGQEFFLDAWHINHAGNEIVARAIYDTIHIF